MNASELFKAFTDSSEMLWTVESPNPHYRVRWDEGSREPIWEVTIPRGSAKTLYKEVAFDDWLDNQLVNYYPKTKKPDEPKLDLTEDAVENLLGLICK